MNICREPLGEGEISITPFQGLKRLESLQEAWNAITADMTRKSFCHLWEWYHSYLRCMAPDPNAVMFFLFMKGETPVALLPLQFTFVSLGGLKLKALAFPSHNHLLLCDLICRDDALHLPLFPLFIDYLKSRNVPCDLIELPHLVEGSNAIQTIHNHPFPRFLLKPEGGCDFLNTTETYEAFLAALSKNLRGSLKQAKKCLDELSEVEFAFTQEESDLEARLDAFLDVEASGWKGALGSGTAIKMDPSLECFYRNLVRSLAASGRMSINTLTAEGKCIAAQFCITLDNTVYILKIGYDEAYKREAPGNLLLAFFVKKCIEDGVIDNINLVTDAEWHRRWRTKQLNKSTLYVFNATPAGLIGFALLKSQQRLKKYYRAYIQPHLPQWVQILIRKLPHES